MDNNLRDSVEKILRKYCSSSCCFGHEEEATALCSLIADECVKARIDELKSFNFSGNNMKNVHELNKRLDELKSHLKDQKGQTNE